MAIFPTCDKCDKELEFPGGLAFSPPDENKVIKFHLCQTCWARFLRWITQD